MSTKTFYHQADLKLIPFENFLNSQVRKKPELKKAFNDSKPEIYLAYNLARLRIQKGFNQTRLAEKSGVGRATIFYIEDCNFKHNITIRVVDKLARALGVPFTDLFKASSMSQLLKKLKGK